MFVADCSKHGTDVKLREGVEQRSAEQHARDLETVCRPLDFSS
jgi:hypothetical protein